MCLTNSLTDYVSSECQIGSFKGKKSIGMKTDKRHLKLIDILVRYRFHYLC